MTGQYFLNRPAITLLSLSRSLLLFKFWLLKCRPYEFLINHCTFSPVSLWSLSKISPTSGPGIGAKLEKGSKLSPTLHDWRSIGSSHHDLLHHPWSMMILCRAVGPMPTHPWKYLHVSVATELDKSWAGKTGNLLKM